MQKRSKFTHCSSWFGSREITITNEPATPHKIGKIMNLGLQRQSVTVVYAIREADGISSFNNFIASCNEHTMSLISTPRIIVALKDSTSGFRSEIEQIVKGANLNIDLVEVPSSGFAFGSWLYVIERDNAEIFVLLTATSEATADGWVDFLTLGLIDPNVGIIASMCSEESVKETYRLSQLLRVKIHLGIRLSNFEQDISDVLGLSSKKTRNLEIWNFKPNLFLNTLAGLLRNLLLFLFKNRGDWSWKRTFPGSPNLHFRTTGFAVRREVYLTMVGDLPRNKIEDFAMESGSKSLTRLVQASGLKINIYLVGEGLVDLGSQAARRTFRWIGGNSIVKDAHAREFSTYSIRQQTSLQELSHSKN